MTTTRERDDRALGVRRRRPRHRAAARCGTSSCRRSSSEYAPRVLQYDGYYHYVCGDRIELPHPGPRRGDGRAGSDAEEVGRARSRCAAAPSPARASTTWPSTRIEAAALYPTFGLMIQGVTEREPALALCRALNDWLAEYCAHDPARLIGVAHAADDRRRRRARRGASLRRGHSASAACGAGPSTSARSPRLQDDGVRAAVVVPRRGRRAVRHPPRHERAGALRRARRPLRRLLHAAARRALRHRADARAHHVRRLRDPRAPSAPAGRVPRDRRGVGVVVPAPPRRAPRAVRLRPRRAHDEAVRLLPPPVLRVGGGGRARPRRRCSTAYPDSVVFASDYPHADGTFPGSTKDLLESRRARRRRRPQVLRDNALRLYGLDH